VDIDGTLDKESTSYNDIEEEHNCDCKAVGIVALKKVALYPG
jgi:hypothetical protein